MVTSILEQLDLLQTMIKFRGKIELQKVGAALKSKLQEAEIPESMTALPDSILQLDTYDAIRPELVKDVFKIDLTATISQRAVRLDDCIKYARDIADQTSSLRSHTGVRFGG